MEHEEDAQLSKEMMEGIALSLDDVEKTEESSPTQSDDMLETDSEVVTEEIENIEKAMDEQQDEVPKQENAELLANMQEKLDGLEQLLNQQNMNHRKTLSQIEEMVDQLDRVNKNLHKENQELKEGLYDSMRKPILKDIIGICTDLMLEINLEKKKGRTDVVETLEDVLDRLHSVLQNHGVEVYEPNVGDEYEPLVQKVVGTIAASEDNKRRISEVKSMGYRYINNDAEQIILTSDNDRSAILAPARVIVYK